MVRQLPILSDSSAASSRWTLADDLLADQRQLTAVEAFSAATTHSDAASRRARYSRLLPSSRPAAGEQYAFEVDLRACSGCKACVTACHALNGLDDGESWRSTGLLVPSCESAKPAAQHVTTACHHCVDPGCLNGCPVLAYDKDPVTGIVRHLDDQCIGCQYCVMKCPYEVPRYSERLGIVRKCDMCTARLAVGEAPACAQACPTEAITITLVDRIEVARRLAGGSSTNPFLADTPPPHITHPTTLYLGQLEGIPQVAADHASLRLEPAHWPLVWMLVLTQAGVGGQLAAALLQGTGRSAAVSMLASAAFLLMSLGLLAGAFHLGQPLRAWRSFLGWRTSWLSREIMVFSTAAPLIAAAWLLHRVAGPSAWTAAVTWLATVAGLAGVGMSAMVYVDTQRPAWATRVTWASFLATTVRIGALLGAVALGLDGGTSLHSAGDEGRWMLGGSVAASVMHAVWQSQGRRRALGDVSHERHMNARVYAERMRGSQRLLMVSNIAAWSFSMVNLVLLPSPSVPLLCGSLILVFLAEILERLHYFAGAMNLRMPGGVA